MSQIFYRVVDKAKEIAMYNNLIFSRYNRIKHFKYLLSSSDSYLNEANFLKVIELSMEGLALYNDIGFDCSNTIIRLNKNLMLSLIEEKRYKEAQVYGLNAFQIIMKDFKKIEKKQFNGYDGYIVALKQLFLMEEQSYILEKELIAVILPLLTILFFSEEYTYIKQIVLEFTILLEHKSTQTQEMINLLIVKNRATAMLSDCGETNFAYRCQLETFKTIYSNKGYISLKYLTPINDMFNALLITATKLNKIQDAMNHFTTFIVLLYLDLERKFTFRIFKFLKHIISSLILYSKKVHRYQDIEFELRLFYRLLKKEHKKNKRNEVIKKEFQTAFHKLNEQYAYSLTKDLEVNTIRSYAFRVKI
mgnify:CR=1 FL=1|jgi:hypothetical protein